jgi:rare lipoprotein A
MCIINFRLRLELLKIIKIILTFFVIIFFSFGCGSSPRFTSDESDAKDEKVETHENKNEELTKTETMNVLETETGVASFYSQKFHGKKTANGEIYDMNALTAAHVTYPFETIIRVTNLSNNKFVILRVNDRMPDYNGRIIDISRKAAEELDMLITGIAKVKIEVLKWGNAN